MNEGETKLLGVPAKSARERREKREERRERREERRESLSLPLRTCVLLLSSWFRLVRALSAVFPSLFGACPSLVWVCVLLRHAATPLRRFPFLHRLRVCFRGAMNATVMQNLKFDSILGFSDIYNYIYIYSIVFAHVTQESGTIAFKKRCLHAVPKELEATGI